MSDKQSLISQIKLGVRNLISEVKTSVGDLKKRIGDLGFPKIKPVPIPEEWKDPDSVIITAPEPNIPVAVEPTIIYEQTVKSRLQIVQPTWFIKVKRIVVFIIMITTFISSIGLVLTFPFGLIFTIPTFFINFDYLVKTRQKGPIMRWDILSDMEKEVVEE